VFKSLPAIARVDIPDHPDLTSATPRSFLRLKGATDGKTLNALLSEFRRPRESKSTRARRAIGPRRDADADNAAAAAIAWAKRLRDVATAGLEADIIPHLPPEEAQALHQFLAELNFAISDRLP
jgi:hypothetical protein